MAAGNNWNAGGGVIYVYEGNLTIYNSIFNNNTALNSYYGGGGAIFKYNGTSSIYNSTFNNNIAKDRGGAFLNYNGTSSIYNSTFNNNTRTGGAIYNHGNLTIYNSIFNNNTVTARGGAINNHYGNLIIYNCTFQNNTSNWDGGAIEGSGGTFNITDSTFNNNTAGIDGGAISYSSSTLTMTNTTFNNNMANNDGGAIHKNWGTLNVNDSTFNNNTAISHGGVIDNFSGTINITNTTFNKNNAEKGGSINNDCGTLNITNTSFNNNTADDGGAIYNNRDAKLNINNSILQNNMANKDGAAIYNDAAMIIDNNLFITNKANTTGKIIIDKANATIENNTNDETYRYSSTIYTNGTEVTIINNIFDNRNETIVTINKIANVKLNYTVTITGKLTDDTGKTLSNAIVNIKINDKSVNVKIKSNGVYKYTTKTTIVGLNNITVTYEGDQNYLGRSNKTTFLVKQPTCINIASTSNVKYGTTVKLVGRLLNGTNAVKYVPVNVTVNGKNYKVKTNGAGYFTLNYTVKSYADQKVTFKFAGNSLYLASSNSTVFKVKQPTSIKMANMTNVKYGSTVKLVGRLLSKGTNAVKYVLVNVTVNGKVYKLKTDGAGYFRLNYTATTLGTVTFNSKFAGNNLYLASTNSTNFTVVKS